MAEFKDPVERARNLVRRGYFALAVSDASLMATLSEIRNGESAQEMARWFSAQSLLGEIFDQTGNYGAVSKLFSKSERPEAVLKRMKKDGEHLKHASSVDDSLRRLVRSQGLWLLQFAISRLRRFDLDGAGKLMERCQFLIEDISANGPSRFHYLLSQIRYWEGRLWMSKNDLKESKQHFLASIVETERNLDFHLSRPLRNTRAEDCQVIYAVYSLASCTAFGLAQISYASGELKEAINLVHPALAMFMGTGDNYRRGGAIMIMGAASRAIAGTNVGLLRESIETLERSLELFGSEANHRIAHRLHEAHVQYQLSLAFLCLAQGLRGWGDSQGPVGPEATSAMDKATFYNDRASEGLEILGGYADPQLKSDVLVVKSRIHRFKRDFEAAFNCANAAASEVRHFSFAEASSSANALIARGEALLAKAINCDTASITNAEREELFDQAQDDFLTAADKAGGSPTIAAATKLHIAKTSALRGNTQEARHYLHLGLEDCKRIENRWVHEFSKEVEKEVKLPPSMFQMDLKLLESDVSERNGRLYDEAVTVLRKYLLVRSRSTDSGNPRTPDQAANYLGVSRPTYFNWARSARQASQKGKSRTRPRNRQGKE